MDRVSFLSNEASFQKTYQDASSVQAIAELPSLEPSSFVFDSQTTMPTQNANRYWYNSIDVVSRVSNTPRSSHLNTPGSVFSLPQQQGPLRDGSGEFNTPASSVVDGQISRNDTNMSPSHTVSAQSKYMNPAWNTSLLEVQNLSGDSNGQEWFNNASFEDTLSQAPTTNGTFQNEFHPLNNSIGDGHSSQYLLGNTQRPAFFQSQQHTASPTTSTVGALDPVLGVQDFSHIPLYEDLDSNDILDAHDEKFTTGGFGNYGTYYYTQPPTGTYPHAGLGLGAAGIGANSYPSSHRAPAFLPSNGAVSDQSVGGIAVGRGPQATRDADTDEKLVRWRGEGLSYKEIMKRGNFGLEESTLRGRYRTLTKRKEERLRKPQWPDHAVQALKEAVEIFSPNTSSRPRTKDALDKIPWKKVAEWMKDNRSCYHYGNATVKKKYQDIVKEEQLRMRRESRNAGY